MKRREFITLLGGAAAAWPLAARGQQPERVRRIGVLVPFAETHAEAKTRISAFRQELQKLGWSEGRNVIVESRYGGGSERLRPYAAELIRLAPDVILAETTQVMLWGFAPSINARLAFTAFWEIPPFGSLAAAISCCSEASTKALEAVLKAFFNLCHHSRACPSGG
jgi:hypothetical protein